MIPDEREWQAQEMAMRCERAGRDLPAADTVGAAYLTIAKALNQPLEPLLPADFAFRVAAMAANSRPAQEVESPLERILLFGLACVFGISALVAVMLYGSSWLGNSLGMLAQVGTSDLTWVLALAACLAVSWSGELLRRRVADQAPNPV